MEEVVEVVVVHLDSVEWVVAVQVAVVLDRWITLVFWLRHQLSTRRYMWEI